MPCLSSFWMLPSGVWDVGLVLLLMMLLWSELNEARGSVAIALEIKLVCPQDLGDFASLSPSFSEIHGGGRKGDEEEIRALLLDVRARSGRRGGGRWTAVMEDGVRIIIWLFLAVLLCGSCCWLWPERRIRPLAGIGASPPPICYECPDPGVRIGWSLRRFQRGVILYRFLLATQLLLLVFVFDSGVPSVELSAVAERSMQRRSQGSRCNFHVVKGFFCNLGTAGPNLDVSCNCLIF